MFGPDATQHAPPGSYPAYFQQVIESGLQRPDAPRNPFLQHIFLGYYIEEDAPCYLQATRALDITLRLGGIPDMADIARFDVIHVSNIFDWCDVDTIRQWALPLKQLASGAAIIVRQLNNQRNLAEIWGDDFIYHPALSNTLAQQDRSLFYQQIQVWRRR